MMCVILKINILMKTHRKTNISRLLKYFTKEEKCTKYCLTHHHTICYTHIHTRTYNEVMTIFNIIICKSKKDGYSYRIILVTVFVCIKD